MADEWPPTTWAATMLKRWKERAASGEALGKPVRLGDIIPAENGKGFGVAPESGAPPGKKFAVPPTTTVPLKVGKNDAKKPKMGVVEVRTANGTLLASGKARWHKDRWVTVEPMPCVAAGTAAMWLVRAGTDGPLVASGTLEQLVYVDTVDLLDIEAIPASQTGEAVTMTPFGTIGIVDMADLLTPPAWLDEAVAKPFTDSFSLYGAPHVGKSGSMFYGSIVKDGTGFPWAKVTAPLAPPVDPATCPHTSWSYPDDRCPACGTTAKALMESGQKSARADAATETSYVPGKRAVRLDE